MDDKQSLAHTTWDCEYHKYRGRYFTKRREQKILRMLCEKKFISGKRPQMGLLF